MRLNKMGVVIASLAAASFVLSCVSAAEKLQPPRSAMDVRLDDVAALVSKDPERAIHLLGAFGIRYGVGSVATVESGTEADDRATELFAEAVSSLRALRDAAVAERRWEDAASLSRSLMALGTDDSTRTLADYRLEDARDLLAKGEDLAAFLAAAEVQHSKPLSAPDALAFLKRAVDARQRRSAAFFLAAAEASGASVPASLREYATVRDSPSDMIKGVATVWVDRGIKIEKGRGSPDRVIGSAFFVDAKGLLVTNYHVISSEVDPEYEGYSRLFIRLGDATSPRLSAKVVGWDRAMDLAVLKADIVPEYVFSVLDGVAPTVGSRVYAIGSPAGLEKTVTAGIVSAAGRRFLQIGDVVQIDAAVNHGNSGGPVVDEEGRLSGVVFAGIEQFEGLNFAVPSARLAAALPAMLRGGKAERPWLGLALAENRDGVEIIYVAPGTPASDQLVAENIDLVSLNGVDSSVRNGLGIVALQDSLFTRRPGELVALRTSDGQRRILATTARPPLPLAAAAKMDSRERVAAPLFGLILTPGGTGASSFSVKKVLRGSIADEAGLSENDPVSIRSLRIDEKAGFASIEVSVKKKRMGYLETTMSLPTLLDSPDTL
jgi:S1-C subfamily serine protease